MSFFNIAANQRIEHSYTECSVSVVNMPKTVTEMKYSHRNVRRLDKGVEKTAVKHK